MPAFDRFHRRPRVECRCKEQAAYAALEDKIVDLAKRRNKIAQKIITILENAAFHDQEINEEEAEHLIEQAEDHLESIE